MKTFLRSGAALTALALMLPAGAYAQSTGSREVEAESGDIVVTGTRRQADLVGLLKSATGPR